MELFHYHPHTGELLGQSPADADPLQPGHWLIPAHATDQQAPETQPGKAQVFKDNRWQLIDDCRGQSYWLSDGSEHKIEELGQNKPADALDAPPPPTIEELAAEERAWRNAELTASDRLMLADFPLTAAQREAISQYRAALRIGPNTDAAFPNKSWRPVWPEICPRD